MHLLRSILFRCRTVFEGPPALGEKMIANPIEVVSARLSIFSCSRGTCCCPCFLHFYFSAFEELEQSSSKFKIFTAPDSSALEHSLCRNLQKSPEQLRYQKILVEQCRLYRNRLAWSQKIFRVRCTRNRLWQRYGEYLREL